MRPPCEVVQKEFLPAVRSEVARLLRERGLSQSEIAEKMDVTQAAVSKYLSSTGAERPDPDVVRLSRTVADDMVAGATSDQSVKDICSVCMRLRIGGSICRMHRDAVPSLKISGCEVCGELLAGREDALTSRVQVLHDMRNAIEVIERNSSFRRLIPQVRANVVSCGPDASVLGEVAGIPGRITLVGGSARALMPPQFGASAHTADILLWAKDLWKGVRACFCVAGSEEVVATTERQGIRVLRLSRSAVTRAEIAQQVGAKAARYKSADTLGLHAPGGIGIEPILYVFGRSAQDLAEVLVDIADKLPQ
jgi:predicted fused transcriptional regulator/phosphomethylpyrimidine kinase/predicted transcriptional regulator